MHILVLKLDNPNSTYVLSKLVAKTAHFAQVHIPSESVSTCSNNENPGFKRRA